MERPKNKTEAVLRHLKEGKTLTSLDSFHLFRATRLSDIIYRLRGQGYAIINLPCEVVDRYGQIVKFVEYKLEDKHVNIE
jgi:hypothetical protein